MHHVSLRDIPNIAAATNIDETSAYTKDIGDSESYEVAYCTKAGHGARLMPRGTLSGVHFVRTKDYVQITGTGDFTSSSLRHLCPA